MGEFLTGLDSPTMCLVQKFAHSRVGGSRLDDIENRCRPRGARDQLGHEYTDGVSRHKVRETTGPFPVQLSDLVVVAHHRLILYR